MQHSNCYSNVKNTDHSISSQNTGLFNCKIGSPLQIALFFLYQNFHPTPPSTPSPLSAVYSILPNVPTPRLLAPTARLFRIQKYVSFLGYIFLKHHTVLEAAAIMVN